ncbi:MAG: hypothetical protein ACTS5Y_08350 [Pollutimonas bauzanensis]|uniref:Glycine zipper n=1 Tax=Pollutimonas bauzanensis TaxID=658167 RepID=A0A1M5ZBK2_9BURK|nr:hypothetical protein [Pollutimonas bauzanensis]SHI21625.1 hypothetical protein SAMN04488135_113137 [Pollutimonas bauzanensis]
MSLIVAARFETFDAAEKAAAALMDAGVTPDALHTFFVNPPGAHDRYPLGGDMAADPDSEGAPYSAVGGAAAVGVVGALVGGVIAFTFADSVLPVVGGAGVGAYIGSLAGAMYSLGKARPRRTHEQAAQAKSHEGRKSGVLLAVHTSREHEKRMAAILRSAGGVEVERAEGRWTNGHWEDFDPLVSPELEKNF